MKKLYTLVVITLIGFVGNAQIVYIPDANFKAKLISLGVDANNDGDIQFNEASQVSSLDVSNSTISDLTGITNFFGLTFLDCSSNTMSTLDVSGLIYLAELKCSSSQLLSLQLSNLPNLQHLDFSQNQISSIDINSFTNLRTLKCYGNQLSILNINSLTDDLTTLYCYSNLLTSLTVNGLNSLSDLDCRSNQLTSLNLTGLGNLISLNCDNNPLPSLNVSGLTNLQILGCTGNQLTSLNVSGLTNLHTLNCSYNQLQTLNLSGLTNLQYLDCPHNPLTSLNVNGLNNLLSLVCNNNLLPSLDVSGLTNLQYVDCYGNQLQSLNVNGLTNLQYLGCAANLLESLNLSGLNNLITLWCNNNQFQSLNVSELTNLQALYCYNNQLTSINVSGLTNLQSLTCANNQLSSIDVSGLTNFQGLDCSNNQLSSLFLKNGNEIELIFSANPSLEYICADESQVASIQTQITGYGYTNCHVNSYCSFVPGGTFYTIQGNSHYDSNANGCDSGDIIYPNLKLSFSDGTNSGNSIADSTGTYRYDVQTGTQTFAPVLENSSYFTVSPTLATVVFPTTTSPFAQDFCLSANGTHIDLEIALLPIGVARPGFDAVYKIIYKNKGTNTQLGTVSLAFDDGVLELIEATPSVSSQTTNNLNWDFTDLLPFETREILVTLNVNSPIETPPVNGGDVLNCTASVIGATDETPSDNAATLDQTVVNSFDPNDKTCLEGATITPSMVGNYVHYVIRFENTGSANAENIVVKDIIDTTKFDVSTLVPLSGSASFVTRITNTNKVEFIFQNIQLPFDDANNDGYVAFKIKTKPTLVLGNTFSNTASIFFDYNMPIVTNTYTTTVTALATQDFDYGIYFSLFPNPAKEVLNMETKAMISVKSINIYNVLGQMVIAIPNAETVFTIDVSDLKTGTYFIKVNTDKGTANTKFIKE